MNRANTLTRQDILECRLDGRPVEGGRLDEVEIVLLRKDLGLIRRHSAQMSQIRLVADEHDAALVRRTWPHVVVSSGA